MNTIDNATTDQLADMLKAPIVKMYKRCARGKHDQCPGFFETWSVCSCDCHAGVSDERPAPTIPVSAPEKPVTCADKAEAVAEAVAIVSPTPAKKSAAPKLNAVGLPPIKGPKNLAGGAKVATGCMKTFSTFSYGREHTPTAFETCTDPQADMLAPFAPRNLTANDAIARCATCRMPLHNEYGNHAGRCNLCNVKAGVMRYGTTMRMSNGVHVEDTNVEFIRPVTAETFAAMCAEGKG